jgi:hypothetical protein
MKQQVEAVAAARRLWNDDTQAGSVAAVVLVLCFVGWPLYQYWRGSQ